MNLDRKPMLRSSCLFCLGLVLLLPGMSGAAEGLAVTPFQIRSFAGSCVQLLQAEKWPELASLYHVPPSGEFDPGHERKEIAASLQALGNEFGRASQAAFVEASEEVLQLTVEGLTQAYWRDRSKYVSVSYRVDFARVGQGYVTLDIILYDNRLQLRSVSFALPEADPEAAGRMQSILDRLRK